MRRDSALLETGEISIAIVEKTFIFSVTGIYRDYLSGRHPHTHPLDLYLQKPVRKDSRDHTVSVKVHEPDSVSDTVLHI